ncbi:MAG: hypothetical protein UDC79_09575, partial [Acutalibacteraceae bacterium]|nr:hypothetical protein [Acutalibacteraceae bacterium]
NTTFYAADFFFLKIGTLCFAVFESFPLIPPRKALPYPDKQFLSQNPLYRLFLFRRCRPFFIFIFLSPTFVYLFPIYISINSML